MLLEPEIPLASAAGRLSRIVGRGGRTRCRATSSRPSTRPRSTGSRGGCRSAPPSSPRRTARPRRARCPRRSCARFRLAHNGLGANLVSGVASTLLAANAARSSACLRSTRPRVRTWRAACARVGSRSGTSSAASWTATASWSTPPTRTPSGSDVSASGTSTSSRSPTGSSGSSPRASAPPSSLRFEYSGLPEERIEVVPQLERALDRGLEPTQAGGELVFLPTYTAMRTLRRIVAACAGTSPTGCAPREGRRRPRVSPLPEHPHRPPCSRGGRHGAGSSTRCAPSRSATSCARASTPCSTSAAARTARRRSSPATWRRRARRCTSLRRAAARCWPSAGTTASPATRGAASAARSARTCTARQRTPRAAS